MMFSSKTKHETTHNTGIILGKDRPIEKQVGEEFTKKEAPFSIFPLFFLIFISNQLEHCSQRSWFFYLWQMQSCFF